MLAVQVINVSAEVVMTEVVKLERLIYTSECILAAVMITRMLACVGCLKKERWKLALLHTTGVGSADLSLIPRPVPYTRPGRNRATV